ncbi:MAG: hypothetical protein WC505_02245 [Patescibacteria group bacterium]
MNTDATVTAQCPQCHQPLNVTWESDRYTFRCSCGYRSEFPSLTASMAQLTFTHRKCGVNLSPIGHDPIISEHCRCKAWTEDALIGSMTIQTVLIGGW